MEMENYHNMDTNAPILDDQEVTDTCQCPKLYTSPREEVIQAKTEEKKEPGNQEKEGLK